MSVKDHPDFDAEVKRLQFTKKYMDAVILTAETSSEQFKENMKLAFEDLDDSDSSLSYTELLANARFFEMSKADLEKLKKLRAKPYFARIDFLREGQKEKEIYYIGKTSLYKRENQEPIIVDWRSPIANLYYEGRIGNESYKAEGEVYHGDLSLKRQYVIEEGELEEVRDIDLTTNDEILQESLAKSASNRLTDIINTIQEEQNRVIRADLNKPIIVQGAAGSGKTTIALHRISYFIYNYAEYFQPENLMILAPSRLFIDYISEVLPELGVEKVKQFTFTDFVLQCIGVKVNVINDQKLIQLVEQDSDEVKTAAAISGLKGSRLMKQILDRYIEHIEYTFRATEDVYVDKYKIFTAKKWTALFRDDYQYLPIYRRVEKLKLVLQNDVRQKKKQMVDKIVQFYDDKIEKAIYRMKDPKKRQAYVSEALDRKELRVKEIQKAIRNAVPQYIRKFPRKKLLEYYEDLFENPERLIRFSDGKLTHKQAQVLCSYSLNLIAKKKFEMEDLAPLLYLQQALFGIDPHYRAKNVVIDEAQDYSYLQFASLKAALETDMFTVVGDLAQGIHSYRGMTDWQLIKTDLFPRATYVELQKSYRTTVEIMEEANKLLPLIPEKTPKVEPVVRHGEKPYFIQIRDKEDIIAQVEKWISSYKEEGFQTFAIIGKTMKDCRQLAKILERSNKFSTQLLHEQDQLKKENVVIVPSYLVKGLEFDVVFIVALDEAFRKEVELDVKLLYVSMTRPLHRLLFLGKKQSDFILVN
ncbi:DNA helicase-2/ATP-dependent DNA helicase PcrA [Bacillus oleivorans]|uniref:DNA helicase-2/ATP-dependent DNA helicase PcrA n=1 Tax=Bacillus oleivorans TaxID=1448271 RepID=A0A285CSK6_9BACI|nr:RNA polymerase recycling motor HelD [Bacillus oleivorans]SNX69933.1 DNA helicase-2/ATP-dependent DNA helicase PcrA [Bacillus oleivorans]